MNMDINEMFRNEFRTALCKKYDADAVSSVLTVLDNILYKYNMSVAETAIATVGQNVKSIVEDYMTAMLTNGVKKTSAKNYLYIIKDFIQFVSLPVNMIGTKECRAYIANLQEKNKDTTVSQKGNVIKQFFQWCVEEEYIDRNPMLKVKTKHGESEERKPLTDTESVELNLTCETDREKAICTFFASTGCRISELSNVKIDDIDFTARRISIINAKGGKNRTVMFNAELELALKQYLKSRKGDSPYLFVINRAPYHKMTTHSIREEFEKVIARSAIGRRITPHFMRHTFITNMLNRGAPINEVALIAGHASVNTTSRVYAHIATKNLENTYQKYA